MNRREFSGLLLTSIGTLAIPNISFSEQKSKYHAIYEHFGEYARQHYFKEKQILTHTKNEKTWQTYGYFQYFIYHKNDQDMRPLSIDNIIHDYDQKIIDELFNSIPTISRLDLPNRNRMIVASNRIALKSRRGLGKFYFQDDDSVMLWYQGSSLFDTPLQTNMKYYSYTKNPNFDDYFIRVQNCILSNEDHGFLMKHKYTRIT